MSPNAPESVATIAAVCLLGALAQATTAFAFSEVPFITTPDAVTRAMLELAEVGPQDRLIDLGSGDGRIVIAAAQLYRARGLGVELVPELVERSRASASAAGVSALTEFRVQDLFETDLRGHTVVTMYLLPEVNLQLRSRLLALAPGTRIVSHDWDLGDWRPERTMEIPVPDKSLGQEKLSRVHRWTVPARLEGVWCEAQDRLMVQQRFDAFSAEWRRPYGQPVVFDGRIRGLRIESVGMVGPALTLAGNTLQVNGRAFVRCIR